MNKIKKCEVENCIPTPSSCVEWNGGDIEFLGICDGDSLNTLMEEVVSKLKEIAGEDLSSFDIDSLLDICNQKAPLEVTILSILNLLKDNQLCLKDFIDTLSEQIAAISNTNSISVNLKCYAEFDNQGNSLAITRDQLDQLVIDNLCDQKQRIETLEGKVIMLQSQIDNIDVNPTVDELTFATCIDALVKPTSSQVVSVANELCDLETATGDSGDINSALANTPGDLNAEFGLITGWILTPANWAQNYNNLLLELENLRVRIKFMEDNCCAATCEDIKLGFTAIFNEDGDGVIIKFTAGAGTAIPAGFTDSGSTVVITDKDGNTTEGVIDIVTNFNDNLEYEISVSGLNLTGDLTVNITAKIGNDAITCEKCLTKTVKASNCGYCTITASGADGSSASIIYDDGSGSVPLVTVTPPTTTTTTTTTL